MPSLQTKALVVTPISGYDGLKKKKKAPLAPLFGGAGGNAD